jgi:hypothetical protein
MKCERLVNTQLFLNGYREERSGESWRIHADPLVVLVRADIIDPQVRMGLCVKLLSVYRRLAIFWDIPPQVRVEIHLEIDAEVLQSKTGLRIPHCIPNLSRVYLVPSSSLGHELSHIFAYSSNPHRDKLLDEGAATVMNQRDTRLFIDWQASQDADDVDLYALFASQAEYPQQSCQYIAGSFVAHVIRVWGRNAFLALFQTTRRNTDGIRSVLTVSWQELVREWRHYLKCVKLVAPQLKTIAARAKQIPDKDYVQELESIDYIIGGRTELRILQLQALLRLRDHDSASKIGRILLAAVDERSDSPATLAVLYDAMARLEHARGRESIAHHYNLMAAQYRIPASVDQLIQLVSERNHYPSVTTAPRYQEPQQETI